MAINLNRQAISLNTKMVLEEYMKARRFYKVVDTLDCLGFKLKMRPINQWVFDETEGHTGWLSAIEFFEGNPINGIEKELNLKFFRKSPNGYDKCCDFTARKFLAILDTIP